MASRYLASASTPVHTGAPLGLSGASLPFLSTRSLKVVRNEFNPLKIGKPPVSGSLPIYSRRLRLNSVATESAVSETETNLKGGEEPVTVEKHEYQAEVSRLLDIIVHSLYSHTEVFLRELVSNASDALDKLRFLSVTDPSLLGSDPELAIKIRSDKDARILVIQDSGIGMTKDDLVHSLGTIAQSGTANFLKALKENKETLGGDNGLIGKFGVGFYSAFLVADKVVVTTRPPNSDKQYVWEAEANSSAFIIREETDPDFILERGTAVILHIKEDALDYLDTEKVQDLVKNYSQFISFPIYVGREKPAVAKVTEDGTEPEKEKKTYSYELVNETKPIWMRNPKEITKEEYHAFYKKTYDERLDPMAYSHFNTEGEVEFKSLLYIPGMAPFSSDKASSELKNIKLYVRRVFISDDFHGALFPSYLSFMKGVVDSNDLPLNVSRELLQESRIMNLMKKRLTKKSFDLFDSIMKRKDPEEYKKFWRNYGKYIKMGISEDKDNQKRLSSFLRYYSSKHQEEMTSLKDYVENMKEDQQAIYYFSSESVKSARNAPFMEKLVERGYEVLFLTEPLDEVSINALKSFKGKDFIDVSKEDFDIGDDEEQKQLVNEYAPLCDWMKDMLGEKISKVEVSKRLSTSPCALISGKYGWSANMERMMRAQNLGDTPGLREYMASTRILEINPNHRIIQYLDDARLAGKDDTMETVELLYETALMSSGFAPEDPAGLGSRIYQLIEANVSGGNNVNQVYSETQYNAASQGYNEGQYNTPSPGYNEGPYNAAGQVYNEGQYNTSSPGYNAASQGYSEGQFNQYPGNPGYSEGQYNQGYDGSQSNQYGVNQAYTEGQANLNQGYTEGQYDPSQAYSASQYDANQGYNGGQYNASPDQGQYNVGEGQYRGPEEFAGNDVPPYQDPNFAPSTRPPPIEPEVV